MLLIIIIIIIIDVIFLLKRYCNIAVPDGGDEGRFEREFIVSRN